MISTIKYYYKKIYQKFHYETFKGNILLAKQLIETNKVKKNIKTLDEVAFQVFSQWGEDGIIQYIISQIEIPNKIFIEFGVEKYTESNTRFLLLNNYWKGMVIDGDKKNIRFIKSDFIYWKYDITAYHNFISAENINVLLTNFTNCTDIGLLSIDIDGNDYWVWKAIDSIQPRIVICEYNASFGNTHKVTIPYFTDFSQTKAHYSNLYYGASLGALCYLAEKKGYDFIGTASEGVNAFFVRKDLSGPFIKYNSTNGFHAATNRASKDKNGKLNFLSNEEGFRVIENMPLFNILTGETTTIKELYIL